MRNKRIKSARQRLNQRHQKQHHIQQDKKVHRSIDELNAVQSSIKSSLNDVQKPAKPSFNLLVKNWRSGWKWFSSWAFALIIFVATVPVPDEILAVLPEDKKNVLLAFLAFWGLVCRFINQSPAHK